MTSFDRLVKEACLEITNVSFDSSALKFWGSEQYKKDIPLEVENSYKVNSRKSMFTPRQIAEFDKQAKELNAADQGDQSAFLIAVRVTDPGSVGA